MPKLYHNGAEWQVPGEQDKRATRIDVPGSPGDLAAWLNARRTPAIIDVTGHAAVFAPSHAPTRETQLASRPNSTDPLAAAHTAALERLMEEARSRCPKCGDKASTAAAIAESQNVGAITDWILDRANPAQIEQIFGAMGARYHELRKEAGK